MSQGVGKLALGTVQFGLAYGVTNAHGRVLEIQSKQQDASSKWIWGAFSMPATILAELHDLWRQRGMNDVYFGPLVNAYLAAGGEAWAYKAGRSYVDVGTLHGYRAAIRLLSGESVVRGAASFPVEDAAGEPQIFSTNQRLIG